MEVITIRLSPKGKKELKRRAEKKGVGLSEYVRWILLKEVETVERKEK